MRKIQHIELQSIKPITNYICMCMLFFQVLHGIHIYFSQRRHVTSLSRFHFLRAYLDIVRHRKLAPNSPHNYPNADSATPYIPRQCFKSFSGIYCISTKCLFNEENNWEGMGILCLWSYIFGAWCKLSICNTISKFTWMI